LLTIFQFISSCKHFLYWLQLAPISIANRTTKSQSTVKLRRYAMDVKDFCSAMESEMTSWKAKMYDAMRKIDKLGSAEKENILMNIQDLNMIMDDMVQRVEQLRTECPSDWSPIKKDLEKGSVDMRGKYDETMEAIGKASPVSIAG
ncbi:MAG: hypothetical protein PVJ53_16635, partial [Desulfobacterales bacterium]